MHAIYCLLNVFPIGSLQTIVNQEIVNDVESLLDKFEVKLPSLQVMRLISVFVLILFVLALFIGAFPLCRSNLMYMSTVESV